MSARGLARRRDPIAALSFVASRDGKTLPKPTGDQHPRCFWNVTPTGGYGRDCKIGRALAFEYLELEEADTDGPGYLGMIVRDMPRPLTGVEIGFSPWLLMPPGPGQTGHARSRHIGRSRARCGAVMTSADTAPGWPALIVATQHFGFSRRLLAVTKRYRQRSHDPTAAVLWLSDPRAVLGRRMLPR